MPGSVDRILTTHVGSLVRPPKLVEFLHKIEDREPYDQAAYEACSRNRSTRWSGGRPRPASTSSATASSARAATGPSTCTTASPAIDAAADAGRSEGPHGVRRRRTGPRRLPRILRRVRSRFGTGQAARLTLRGQRPAQLLRRPGQARHRQSQGGRRQGQGELARSFRSWRRRARCRAPRTSITPTRKACCSRSPTVCTRNTKPSSTPASTCRSTTRSCPTCTRRWCRR